MKKILAVPMAALLLLGVLSACGRLGQRRGGDPAQPPAATAPSDPAAPQATGTQSTDKQGTGSAGIEADLSSIDNLLRQLDSELTAADASPEDND
jgi:hypothetical protein